MRRILFIMVIMIAMTTSVLAQTQYAAEVRITADNIYWAWLNPGVLGGDGTTDSSYLGNNTAGQAASDNWSTPESYSVQLNPGVNTIVVKAMNVVGETPYGNGAAAIENPAGLLACVVMQGRVVNFTDVSWQYSFDENPTVTDNWRSNPAVISDWDGGTIWNGQNLPGLINGFSGTGAKWIWSDTYPFPPDGQPTTVWFKTTVITPVPEPSSLVSLLSCLGTAGVIAYRRSVS